MSGPGSEVTFSFSTRVASKASSVARLKLRKSGQGDVDGPVSERSFFGEAHQHLYRTSGIRPRRREGSRIGSGFEVTKFFSSIQTGVRLRRYEGFSIGNALPFIELPQTKSNAADSDSLVFRHYSSRSPDSLELQKTTTELLEFVRSEIW